MSYMDDLVATAAANILKRQEIADAGNAFGAAHTSVSTDEFDAIVDAEMSRRGISSPDDRDIFADQAYCAQNPSILG